MVSRSSNKLFLFVVFFVFLMSSFVYAQTSQSIVLGSDSLSNSLSCAPNIVSDDKCAIYSISRENVEKHWPGCSAATPQNCPVIPVGASDLPTGVISGQMIDTDVIINAVIFRLQSQNLPSDPPRDWNDVLGAKRAVMSKIMGALGGASYKGPKMIDFRGKKPILTGGNPNGINIESRPVSLSYIEPKFSIQLISLVFVKLFKFFELPVSSVSANLPPPAVPVVVTFLFSNPDGTTYKHSLFCWATGVNWQTGDGHYVCRDHKNQGGYAWILDSKNEKVTGKRLSPYPGPDKPLEEAVIVNGILEVIISHDVR